jgi:hypothetical protein
LLFPAIYRKELPNFTFQFLQKNGIKTKEISRFFAFIPFLNPKIFHDMVIRKGFIRKVKDITLGSTLTLALMGGTVFLPSCGSSNDNEETAEELEHYEEVYTKGLETYITETEPNVFKITDEKVVGEGQSKAIITYKNGKTETLTIEQAKQLVEKQMKEESLLPPEAQFSSSAPPPASTAMNFTSSSTPVSQTPRSTHNTNATSYHDPSYQQPHYQSSPTSGLGSALLYGGLGYMMGSTISNYRAQKERDLSSRGGSAGAYYHSSSAFARSRQSHTEVHSSRSTRSSGSSSRGFFGRSSSSSRSSGAS